jgi:hypothetical protein
MSYDLMVATTREPPTAVIIDWVARYAGVRAAREGGGAGRGWQLERRRLLGWRHVATIDEPVRAEPGDLHEVLRAGVRNPGWLIGLHLPLGAPKDDRELALALATHLAQTCEGAAFDPQLETLVWPAKPIRPVRAPRQQRIRLIHLEWFIRPSRAAADLPGRVIELLEAHCPEALPRRYESFEPPQERFEGVTAKHRFGAFWNEEASIEHGGSLFWTTTRPVLGGSATFPDRRDRFRPPGAARAVRVALGLDGTRVEDDAAWLDRTIELFATAAGDLDAVYAHGYVERNVILRRGVWYDRDSEVYPRVIGRWFVGLPDAPMWLAWFGPEYAGLVGPSIPTDQQRARGTCLLVQRGRRPMDLGELDDVPLLPAELVITRTAGAQQPAATVPDLD